MKLVPSLMTRILRDFCHVEWYEVKELRVLIASGDAKFDVELFKKELAECIMSYPAIPVVEINRLSGNEFRTQDEARRWLTEIRRDVLEFETSASDPKRIL
ncbi:hypothetical protein [Dyella flagellata]|uniref:Uncharacterized protein n=1 Tax=Dyella flagellata TaxID=1867833 RepID=A0ABQ5X8D4_9GAMM|nr:hypothetical protein [Dyella flagellata]GLQ87858.1 hypothetical protein GCM10007898_14260 [Dyella flagellata]